MIPFEFIYCRPNTLAEAVEAFVQLQTEGQNPFYYAGGSEIITMCRAGSIHPGAVIDIKSIPECNQLEVDNDVLNIGGACSLNKIKESKLFPLLRLACGRIADHTNQCRITLGGNLCGTIIYRETSLALLVSDAQVTLLGPEGRRTVSFKSIFNGRINLKPGEFIVQVQIPSWALNERYAHIKKTENEKIDYPLVTVAAIWKGDVLRAAFSGLCSFPFRSEEIESVLNDRSLSCEIRAEKAAQLLPDAAYNDVEGSGEYRVFVLRNTLCTLLEDWESGKI
ncbi:FAD binding domain-containing protein [Oscillospiraceae bacterium LTW-04]|nr:FAD binding domain-containing protein [Oscillospiraceae bacterium MB24-C1]